MVDQGLGEKQAALANMLGDVVASLDEQKLGFADAVMISGIDARQLRNGLERSRQVFNVGRKHPSLGRWVFTMRDCLLLMIAGELNNRALMPVSHAADAARRIAETADVWWRLVAESLAPGTAYDFQILSEDGELKVHLRRRGADPAFLDLDGNLIDVDEPSIMIVLRAWPLLLRFVDRSSFALLQSGPEAE